MNARGIGLALAMIGALATPAWPQGYAGLSDDASGFSLPDPARVLTFPADHGSHPDFRIEWWYVTANLTDDAGNAYGAQWTLFRTALSPGETVGWDSPQVWFAHAAITTPTDHLAAETRARGGIDQAGVTPSPFTAWINDWSMTSAAPAGADQLSAVRLVAQDARFGFDLSLTADGPLILQGENGYSVKSERKQASHYYSQPFYEVTGHLRLPSGEVEVSGRAWLDREWSSQPLAEDQTGWDWFSLHLDGGAKLMLYRLRDASGDAYVSGTWITADGSYRSLGTDELSATPADRRRITGRRIPTEWHVTVPGEGVDIRVTPLNRESWMDVAPPYWEGPVTAAGTHPGIGYLEMTGY